MAQFTYDREANAIYIQLEDKPYAYGEDIDRQRRVDFAEDGTVIGVEFTCVRGGVDLRELPRRHDIEQILEELRVKVLV